MGSEERREKEKEKVEEPAVSMCENSGVLSVCIKIEAILDPLKDSLLLYKGYFAVLIVISN